MVNRGALVRSDGPIFGGKVFYLIAGKRHWVSTYEWMQHMGLDWGDVRATDDDSLLTYAPGHTAAEPVDLAAAKIRDVLEARLAFGAGCRGRGLEIGAGSSPFPVPVTTDVVYADMFSHEQLVENAYPGQPIHDLVAPTIITELDDLSGIPEDSMDFVIACHVIEHTRNPIRVIENIGHKLTSAGRLVLVVPDKEKSFDINRTTTALDHLIHDYNEYDRENDKAHYEDFFANVQQFGVTPEDLQETWRRRYEEGYSIHFHTWTYESFAQMVEWIVENIGTFRTYSCHPATADGIEFYFALERSEHAETRRELR